jgi:hypothetical protein
MAYLVVITQLFKNQVLFWMVLITITMNAFLVLPKMQELPEKERRNPLIHIKCRRNERRLPLE